MNAYNPHASAGAVQQSAYDDGSRAHRSVVDPCLTVAQLASRLGAVPTIAGVNLPLRGRSIVCISSIDWGFLWQSHQDIMSRFAAADNQVLFIENSGVRTIRLRDTSRVIARLARFFKSSTGSDGEPYPGVQIISPILAPYPSFGPARLLNDVVLTPLLARHVSRLGASDPIIFTYLPTRNALRLIELLRTPASRVVYCCIADFLELTDDVRGLAAAERALVQQADLVFVQGEPLYRRFEGLTDRLHPFHVGINLDVFDPDAVIQPAAEVMSLPRPIIGYSGGLHRFVDFDVLRRVARAFPKGSLVLVGPVQADASPIRDEPNVHLLGQRAFAELPALISAFDIGLIPYVRSKYTDTVYPTKLFEYLALGLPVVGTDLPELIRLDLPSHALRVATMPGFVDAVLAALREATPAERRERQDLAREHGWDEIVRTMAETIASSEPRGGCAPR